ncbi:MAG: ImmA/IrrE family metallo-endopeptidase, partial [Ignavibacteria bacterium]|nr:ImmA/IrrE family metallo-endopeptidase [Ignavibacteria bacterium]
MSILAKAEAQKIIDYYGISSPEEIELNIISSGLGVYIEDKDIDGSEGRITHDGKRGFIAVNSQITYLPKKRFVIAHELGHFRLHKN